MSILEQMEPIGLADMKAVRLMNRVDQKYMAPASLLEELLGRVADGYYVQHIEGTPLAPYRTLYFDTDDLAMYTMHHNKKLNRQKLRVRTYRSTDTTFFEIKNKDNKKKFRFHQKTLWNKKLQNSMNIQQKIHSSLILIVLLLKTRIWF
jgi:hypothetical protein